MKTIAYRVPKQDKRIWKSFISMSELSHANAMRALMWGSLPIVRVVSLKVNGMFRASRPNFIWIDDTLVRRFETDWQNPYACKFMEILIMHEIVHWANNKQRGKHKHGRYGMIDFDYGDWFELLAIGKNNDVWFPKIELKPIVLKPKI